MSRTKNEVKIQINSLEALERLIGGDTELEMDIRKSVAASFAKKYLKNFFIKGLKENATYEENIILREYIEGTYTPTFTERMKKLIEKKTHAAVTDEIDKAVSEQYAIMSEEITKRLKGVLETIDARIERITNDKIHKLLNEKLEKFKNSL